MLETTQILGRFWGLLTLVISVIYFVRPSVLIMVKQLMVENRPFALLYGILSLILGVATVVLHNQWSLWLPAIVSLFGWLCLLKGIVVLAYPEVSYRTKFETRVLSTRIALVIVCVLAAYMLYASSTGYGS